MATGDTPLTDKSNLNSNSSIARILERDHDINYVHFAQQQAREGIPSDVNPQGEASSISTAGVLSNNISEDQLVVETAGNFGQRTDEIKIPLPARHQTVSFSPTINPVEATQPGAFREQKSVTQKQDEQLVQYIVGTSEQARQTDNSSTFAKPIVVADFNEPTHLYEGEEISSTAPEALPFVSNKINLDDSNDLTTSALVLNPIQAGVSLVNAGKTHLIDANFTNFTKDPAPVVERIEDDHADYLEYDSAAYESINNRVKNNNVEIQKSIEMYHPMPSQEIHYPPQMDQIERFQEYPDVEESWNSQRIKNRDQNEGGYEEGDNFKTSGSNKQEYSLKQNDESGTNSYSYNQKDGKVGYEVEVTPSKVYQLIDYNVQHDNSYDNSKHQQQPIYNQYPMSFGKVPEKRVPYQPERPIPLVNAYFPYRQPVEKVVEKPIPIPVTVEKIIEKKIPVPIQKIVPQPYPVHVPVPQPVPVPIPVEKIVEKKIPIPQPYPIEVEKIIEKKVPVPVEVTKVVEKPVAVNIKGVPYNFPYSFMGYTGMRNDHGFNHQTPAVAPSSSYYVTIPNNHSHMPFQSFYLGPQTKNNLNQNSYQNNYYNNNQNYQNMQNQQSHVNPMIGHSKKVPVYYTIPSNLLTYTLFNAGARRKPMREIYIGPVPPEPKPLQQNMNIKIQRKVPNQGMSKPMTTLSTRPPMQVTVSYRKARHQESPFPNTGNFRQSKMEYGFKPPMVPSIQYDEETGSKVESR